jgi:predicted metal-dependent HD superfamily phosphohydrolase
LAVLNSFLVRPRLFFSDEFAARLESKARYNIRREVEKIQQAPEMKHHV